MLFTTRAWPSSSAARSCRRDHPSEEPADAARKVLSRQGIVPGIKVDTGAEPLPASPKRQSPRGWTGCATASRVSRHGCPLREMARGHPITHIAEPGLRGRECARPRAIRRPLSRAGARADRRAGSTHERSPYDRALRGGHREVLHAVFHALFEQGVSLEVCCQAQHGPRRHGVRPPSFWSEVATATFAACAGTCRQRCPASYSCRAANSRLATVHLNASTGCRAQALEDQLLYGRALQDRL